MDGGAASSRHRHQSSLEGLIFFSSEPSLDGGVRGRAKAKFDLLIAHFDAGAQPVRRDGKSYNRPRLVRLTYEHALSDESRDMFLRAFFWSMALSLDEDDADLENNEEGLRSDLNRFADYLLDYLFLPLRATTLQTPQPSPEVHSAIQRAQGRGEQQFIGTLERMSDLRAKCLNRDRHRCVISRQFDITEATARFEADGGGAKDDDGVLLSTGTEFSDLEVAHIIPHALTKMQDKASLSSSQKATLDILNMFDNGVSHLIEGADIDRPRNAITLTLGLHRRFGHFDVFFEPVPGQEHTYVIKSFLTPVLTPGLPVQRKLFLAENRTIDPPSPRFLALHRAIAHILHLSAAGAYIDRILKDWEGGTEIQVDGSTELGRLVSLRLGWWEEAVH